MLSFEISYGCIVGWQIELSTVPGLLGTSAAQDPSLTLSQLSVQLLKSKSGSLSMGAFCPAQGWRLL